jgi:putative phosphoribosyl transferase
MCAGAIPRTGRAIDHAPWPGVDVPESSAHGIRVGTDERPSADRGAALPFDDLSGQEQAVRIPADDTWVAGDLMSPREATGIVVFAHGSGSSRHSSRNRMVARLLHQRGLATLLMDLLTADEEEAERYTRHLRFDIGLLAGRLQAAVGWLHRQAATEGLPVGLFGASTGAAAALVAAARRPDEIAAVVSRGGRPDLAGDHLGDVQAPTLLIVGGADEVVVGLNQQALDQLRAEARLTVIPGATHLFEEPGALEEVARLAGDWFDDHFRARAARA